MAKSKKVEDISVEAEGTVEEPKGPRMAKKATGISKESKLTVLAESNPKRAGRAAYDRFEGYFTLKADATVADALEAGLTMGDISYDFIHGFIGVEGAEVVEYEVKPRGPRSESDEPAEEAVEATADSF